MPAKPLQTFHPWTADLVNLPSLGFGQIQGLDGQYGPAVLLMHERHMHAQVVVADLCIPKILAQIRVAQDLSHPMDQEPVVVDLVRKLTLYQCREQVVQGFGWILGEDHTRFTEAQQRLAW